MKLYVKLAVVIILTVITTRTLQAQTDPATSVSVFPTITQVGQTAAVSVIASNNGNVPIPANGFEVNVQWDGGLATTIPAEIQVGSVIAGFIVTEVTGAKVVLRNNEAMGAVLGTNYTRTITFNLRGLAITSGDGLLINVNLTILPPVVVANNPVNDASSVYLTIEAALPVTISDFKATKEGDVALLDWKTSMEDNSSHFEVQHSLKGKEWQKVGSVKAEGLPSTYTFSHTNPANGTNLYRLKMVDRDGTFSYSTMRSLQFDVDLTATFAPNPVADFLKVSTNTDWSNVNSVKLFNMSGNSVYSSGAVPDKEISVRNLPNGVYVVQLSLNNGMSRSAKIIIAK